MKLLLNHIDQAPLDAILTYFKVVRREEQPEADWTLYFSPWHKGQNRILRVSNGHRRGGIYASPMWEVTESTANNSGYGAMSLVARLLGIENNAGGRRRIIATICQICEISAPWLSEEHLNGTTSLVDAQKEVTVQTAPCFSIEGLQALGCSVERLYKETSTGKRIPLTGEDGQPVFRYSFGPGYQKLGKKEPNFDPSRLNTELGLYEVQSYTTKSFWQDRIRVSKERKSHPLFPIFVIKREDTDTEGNPCEWGEVLQPEWTGTEGKGCEKPRFLYYSGDMSAWQANTPLMADLTVRMMLQGTHARDAVRIIGTGEHLVTEKTVIEEDADGKKVAMERDIADEDIKVTSTVICADALSAVCTYFHLNSLKGSYPYNHHLQNLFFHVVWPLEGDKSLSKYVQDQLGKKSTNLYLMYDCDAQGKRRAFGICKHNPDIRMATLPERLQEYYSVYRGGALQKAKDIRAFFTDYRMTEEESMGFESDKALLFLSFFTRALPIEPLVKKVIIDKKTGVEKDYEYRVDSACLWQFMATEGYCREVNPNSTNIIGRYIKIDGCFVRELDAKSIIAAAQEALKDYAQRMARPTTEDFRKMTNAIITSRDIIESKASNLPVMDIDYRSGYGPKLDHFFYRNGALRITPDEIKFIPYNQVPFCVDRAEMLPFDFQMPCTKDEAPFRITENPEYMERVKQLQEHRLDTENYTLVQIDEEERALNIWAQTHRWQFTFREEDVNKWWPYMKVLRCFANEEHEEEASLQREGKQFSEEQNRALLARLANILYSLGRSLFRFRGNGTSYMPYITENSVSESGRAEGGSGKSLFTNVFMGCSGKVYSVNARNIRPDTDITLMLDRFEPRAHRVVHWEDWPNGIDIQSLYNYVTSGFQFRQRHKDTIHVSLSESPGHVVTSNFQPTYKDPSSSGRVIPTGFSHCFNRGDIRKNKPQRKVSDVMPGLRDEPQDMDIELRSQIAYVNALAVQFCMGVKERVLPPMSQLNERSQKKAMGDTFVEWAKDFFAHDHVFLCPIDLKTIFGEYVELCDTSDDKKNKFSQATFRNKIAEYCADKGYVCNPDVCYTSATERAKRYMRVKAWCKTIYFEDERIWGPGKRKEIRELRQSQQCLFFVRTEEEAKALTPERVAELRNEYYQRPDPAPCIDPETGAPYELTEEERDAWNIYMLKNQGNYAKANKISGEKSAPVAEETPAKKGEVVPDAGLPF